MALSKDLRHAIKKLVDFQNFQTLVKENHVSPREVTEFLCGADVAQEDLILMRDYAKEQIELLSEKAERIGAFINYESRKGKVFNEK